MDFLPDVDFRKVLPVETERFDCPQDFRQHTPEVKKIPETASECDARQKKFARLVVAGGMSDTEAYAKAYGCSKGSAESNAHRVRAYEGVKALIAELSKRADAHVELTRADKRRRLAEIVKFGEDADAIRAVQVDNQMTGDNAPVRVEGEITLARVLEDITAKATPLVR